MFTKKILIVTLFKARRSYCLLIHDIYIDDSLKFGKRQCRGSDALLLT